MRFGAFIITYERASVLKETIKCLLTQTLLPAKILIVDNSESWETKQLIDAIGDERFEYHHVGYNAGPAGAAKIGLEYLANKGFDWIYWGDDNNPPTFPDTFERLILLANSQPNIGAVGAVGQYFDFNKGVVKRVSDQEIQSNDFLEVDFIGGNMSLLISTIVVKNNVLPDALLFFGSEELDFCTRIKKAGFKIIVDSSLFLKSRQLAGKLKFKPKHYIKKTSAGLKREYYTLRNSLIIANKHGLRAMKFNLHIRWILKMMYGFRYGIKYGMENAACITKAFKDYYAGNSGKTLSLR